MFDSGGQNPKCERTGVRNRFSGRSAVRHRAGKVYDIGDPASVFFPFRLDFECHGNTYVAKMITQAPKSGYCRSVRIRAFPDDIPARAAAMTRGPRRLRAKFGESGKVDR